MEIHYPQTLGVLSLLIALSSNTYAELVCKHPPPQPTPSDTSPFKICAEISPPSQKGTEVSLSGWSGWVYRDGLKENHTEKQTWTSNLDGHLGSGEKITVLLSPGHHTVTLTHDPGNTNYELKTSILIEIKNKPKLK